MCGHNVGVESKNAKMICVIFSTSFGCWRKNYHDRTWRSEQWRPGQSGMPEISFTLKRHNLIPPTYWRELLDTCRNTNSYRLHSRTPEALGLAGLHTSIGCLVVVLRNSCFASPVLCTLKHGNTLDIVYCLILLMKFLSFISKKKVLFKSIYFLFNKKKID